MAEPLAFAPPPIVLRHGTVWNANQTIRYRIVAPPANLDAGQVATLIARAFETWRTAGRLPLQFQEVQADPCEIAIAWVPAVNAAIDGATAGADFPPVAGALGPGSSPNRIMFEAGLPWILTGGNAFTFDVEMFALHEIGHVIGLEHSASSLPVMADTVGPGQARGLSAADVSAAQALYPPAGGSGPHLSLIAAAGSLSRRTISCCLRPRAHLKPAVNRVRRLARR
jgi:hypothetical protein